jgi:TolA-binding protein
LSSCFKTAEQLKREKKVDDMSRQFTQSQSLLSELTLKTKELEDLLAKYQGKIEVLDHRQNLNLEQEQELEQRSVPEKVDSNLLRIEKLEQQMAEIKDYLNKLTGSLKQMKSSKVKKIKTNSAIQTDTKLYEKSLSLFKSKQFDKFGPLCEKLILRNKISAGKINRCRFNLGIVKYENNKFENSLIHFSKIYERWPKSSMAPESLFYIAKILNQIKEVEKAKQAAQQFLKQYPEDKLVGKVQNFLNTLQ